MTHPKASEPAKIRLGKRQFELLSKVCESNGGGVYINISTNKTAQRLEELGLIQGKSGQQYRAVHTRKGLHLYNRRRQE